MRGRTLVSLMYSYFLICMIAALMVIVWCSYSEWNSGSVVGHVLYGGLIIVIVFGAVAYSISKYVSRPLEAMRSTAERFAAGELDARIASADIDELDSLARSLNHMALQLNDRFNIITRHEYELEKVLAGMSEGVIFTDMDENIVTVNDSAAKLLDIDPAKSRGKCIQELVRNTALQKFISSALAAEGVMESEISFYGAEDKFLQLHGTVLRDHDRKAIGVLLVFTDITRLKKLEHIRKDFVANASHELKTPLTALKGCVETLQVSLPEGDSDSVRFLEMMNRHIVRLQALVEDMLSLSTMEYSAEHGTLSLVETSLRGLLDNVVQEFLTQAERRRIALAVECVPEVFARVNPAMMEQAVGNLVDNAIKYSPDGARIVIVGKVNSSGVEISVSDNGSGIEERHLPRIFERFYRVDQARSRAMGGTGLGLAIVKNIALAHHGSVSVSSTPGQGSTFSIHIPG